VGLSISVSGCVGSVTAACSAHIGHNVTLKVIKRLLREGGQCWCEIETCPRNGWPVQKINEIDQTVHIGIPQVTAGFYRRICW
jgi:hypothetical protein